MSSQHEISEYIDNLPLKKTLCKGFRPDDVYDVICNISSMYNQILSEAYAENDELKKELEYMKIENASKVYQEIEKEKQIIAEKEDKMDSFWKEEPSVLNDMTEVKNGDAMTDKELQKLKRGELLEILLEQSRENESLRFQLEEKNQIIDQLNEKLENRRINLENAGTIAEASFMLNGVLEAAEKAAQQYLENLKILHDKEENEYLKKEAEVENRCSALLQATQERCNFMRDDTLKKCEDMEASAKKQCEDLFMATEMKCREREKASEEKCQMLDEKAKTDVDNRWNDLSRRLEDFYAAHEGLRELLASSKMI